MNYESITSYVPSKWAKNRTLRSLPGLSCMVAYARKLDYRVFVDFDEGEIEEINANTASMAVQEVDMAYLHFVKDGECVGVMLAIPENEEDWLSDYHTSLDVIVDHYPG